MTEKKKTPEPYVDHTCPMCGKNFIPAAFHQFKVYGVKVCGYNCETAGMRLTVNQFQKQSILKKGVAGK